MECDKSVHEEFSETEIQKHSCKYFERISLFRQHGYDIKKERDRLVTMAAPLTGNILDVGTGKGHMALALGRQGYHCVSIDLKPEEQRPARLMARFFNVDKFIEFRPADAGQLAFPDQYFGAVFCVDVIHHLDDPFRVVDELLRVTAGRGKLIISDLNEEGADTVERIHLAEGRHHPRTKVTVKALEEYCREQSFDVNNFEDDMHDTIILTRKSQNDSRL